MLKFTLGFALAFFSINSQADCWIVGNLHGMSTSKSDAYQFSKDAFSNRSFRITAEKDYSSVSGSDLNYIGINPMSVLGTFKEGDRRSVETWNISSDRKKVFYTMTRTGFYDEIDGIKAFVGDVLGKC
ncbi:hypothetical protein N4G40_11065 [Pantoea eucrina]|uniref:Uncharacterized protein n=1 Tax=Pantoea eucrina TaxID=472693 RepID=A0ABU5LFU5_9GAMM|nr:hypothetical protein [Pantoea eucrina]MDZ7278810.1 hypothetical protein [Pantoea eucrina]